MTALQFDDETEQELLMFVGSTANCVSPGFVDTEMFETVPDRVQEKILRRIPLDRFATPEEVAGLVRFVASEEAEYITGQILAINDGMEW